MWNKIKNQEKDLIEKTSLLLALKDKGVRQIQINFSGSGDSGDIDDIEYIDMNSNASWSGSHQIDNPHELENKIRDLFFDFVDEEACKYGDWVNNEGGYGVMYIDTVKASWSLDYNQRTIEEYCAEGSSVFI